ncbi:nucleolar complex protein 4 [Nannizzia gypsea CBS 118893]|uniref:Nucleolar complex protein 4 n=1 Tax=Arthroderma gypseum (strain ATCC MYA-4604 / CBS 118893) TaxID=535722 RepID=E4UYJ2_ARTGP|nr:nucleolar complex protein 4 [Nannizzia gypsea CBS 118893]EFR02155.1 nucleolar complex protein 4 [Nannizzia gypsea CBS 118893]
MSPVVNGELKSSKKRKKSDSESIRRSLKRRAVEGENGKLETEHIQELEDQIAESRKYYNNIVTLLSKLDDAGTDKAGKKSVTVSLCRVFCRLLAGGQLNPSKSASEPETILVAWLKERYQEYKVALLRILRDGEPSQQITALSLSMQLIKEQVAHYTGSDINVWSGGYFNDILAAVIMPGNDKVRAHFMDNFYQKYHDITVYTVLRLATYISEERDAETLDNIVDLLSNIGEPTNLQERFENTYTDTSKISQKNKGPFTSENSFKIRVQTAWLAVLRNQMTKSQRKHLLRIMSHVVVPWFAKPELLMDFLTDCYNEGGSTSLLSLSGLFYLIQEKNLDYPQFYTKLYSLLDRDVLHSKHRSRFFRLMDTFLASSHLPATLVASFIKRLSRLALNAPPAAIVVIVPWIYNMLRSHPTCTFMIHRDLKKHDPSLYEEIEEEGMDDPFDAYEPNPTLTNAIESSLWEIETLQSHYHPNTAALARIISEQFTKQHYNVEDFLDLSYQALLSTELGKEEKAFKKAPVVEFQIPKRIFTDRGLEGREEDTEPGHMVRELWDFS